MFRGSCGPVRPNRAIRLAGTVAGLSLAAIALSVADAPRPSITCGREWAWSYELRFLALSPNPAGKSADRKPSPCGGTRILALDAPWLDAADLASISQMFGGVPVETLPWGYLATAPESGESRLSGAVPAREPWVIHFLGKPSEGMNHVHELALSLEGLGHFFDQEISFQARSGETRGVVFGIPSRGQLLVLVTPRRCGVLVPELLRQRRFFAEQVELTPPESAVAPPPSFPVMARVRNVDGAVVMRLLIDEEGQPSDPLVLRAPRNEPSLVQAAVDAIRNWRYRPARENGTPVPAFHTVTMSFRAESHAPSATPPKAFEARTVPSPPDR